MDGVQYQIEQLQRALEQLDQHRLLVQEDAAHLQLALANATAIARRVVAGQTHRTLSMRFTAAGAIAGDENNGGKDSDTRAYQTSARSAKVASASSAIGGEEANDNLVAQTRRDAGDAVKQWKQETIYIISKKQGISVDEIRRLNPQLSVFNDDDVLPRNTYIKMKLQVNQHHPAEVARSGKGFECRTMEPVHPENDAMVVEAPRPLAPLPSVQNFRSYGCSSSSPERLLSGHEKSMYPCEKDSGCTNSPKELQLLLPSPSPSLSRLENSHRSDIFGSEDGFDDYVGKQPITHVDKHHAATSDTAAALAPVPEALATPSLGVSANTSGLRNTADTNIMPFTATPETLPYGARAWKPSTVKPAIKSVTINTMADISIGPVATVATNRLQTSDYDRSLMTESSSYNTTPTPNKYQFLESSALAHSDLENTQLSVDCTAETREGIVKTEDIRRKFCTFSDYSSYDWGNAASSSNNKDEYDTLSSISLQHQIEVRNIVKWNPYLKAYREDEPLPPNLEIVLRRQ